MTFERRIDATPTPDDLTKALGDAAQAFGLHARRTKNPWTLICGSAFSVNPGAPGAVLAVTLDERGVTLTAESRAFPWMRGKVDRLVEKWVDAVTAFVSARLRGEAATPAALPLSAEPDGPGRTFAAAWMFLSIAVGGLLILAVATGLGVVIVDRQVNELRARSELVRSIGAVPIPSLAELASLTKGRIAGAAFLFAAPGAFFAATVMGLSLVLSECFRTLNRMGLWAFLFIAIFLALTLMPSVGWIEGIAFSLAIPLAGFAGYTAVWSCRREVEDPRPPTAKKAVRTQAFVLVIGIAAILVALVPNPRRGVDTVEAMARFRDLYLQPHPWGKAIAEFYYRRTPYAAEPLKPVYQSAVTLEGVPNPGRWERDQRTVLFLHGDTAAAFELRLQGFTVHDQYKASKKGIAAIEADLRQPYDVIIVPAWEAPPAGAPLAQIESPQLQMIRAARLESRTILIDNNVGQGVPLGFSEDQILRAPYRPPRTLEAVLSEFFRERHRGDKLAEWARYGWMTVFYVGPVAIVATIVVPLAALFALLFRHAPRRVAVVVTALVCVASIAGLAIAAGGGTDRRRVVTNVRSIDVGQEGARDRITDALGSDEPAVRYEAAYLAHQYLKPFESPTDSRLQRAQADEDFFKALLHGLEDPDLRVRVHCALAVGYLHKPEGIEPLIRATRDPELFVRYAAAGGLGEIGSTDALEALLTMMDDDAWYAGEYALSALRKIKPGDY